jgi:hypothetical protein
VDKIWKVRVPRHVGGDEWYYEWYYAAVETKDEALMLAREHGYAPDHVETRQIDNVADLMPGVFHPAA